MPVHRRTLQDDQDGLRRMIRQRGLTPCSHVYRRNLPLAVFTASVQGDIPRPGLSLWYRR